MRKKIIRTRRISTWRDTDRFGDPFGERVIAPEGMNLSKQEFMEEILYSRDVPYSIVRQVYSHPSECFLHYGNTIEIMCAEHLRGYFMAYGIRHELKNQKTVIVILPGALHSGAFYPSEDAPNGEGVIYSFKISLEDINEIINLDALLALNGHQLNDLATSVPDIEAFFEALHGLINEDDKLFGRMFWLLKVFELLDSGIREKNDIQEKMYIGSDKDLNQLVKWTHEHMKDSITIDDAARIMNMSKYYFCKYFKKRTCMTYFQFLTQLRVDSAMKMLRAGMNATECCYECGFDSVPYFVRLFKRKTGMTTGEYRKRYSTESFSGETAYEE